MKYTVFSKYRNKAQVDILVAKIREKGHQCYNFADDAADPSQPDAHPEEQMKVYEATEDFYNVPYFKWIFEKDLEGLREADTAILLLPAGTSAHMEAGIAYGMGKRMILIGTPEKPESLYLMFDSRFLTIDEFIASL